MWLEPIQAAPVKHLQHVAIPVTAPYKLSEPRAINTAEYGGLPADLYL